MTRPKWYSPQLARETVRRLYFRAKAERIPMTRLANRFVEKALDTEGVIECRRDTNNGSRTLPSRANGQQARLSQQERHHPDAGSYRAVSGRR